MQSIPYELLQMIFEYCPSSTLLVCRQWFQLTLSTDSYHRLKIFNNTINKVNYDDNVRIVLINHHMKWLKKIELMTERIMIDYPDYRLNVDKHHDDLDLSVEKVLYNENDTIYKQVYRIRGGITWDRLMSEVYSSNGTNSYRTFDKIVKCKKDIKRFDNYEYKELMSKLISVFIDIYKLMYEM